jgi:hypothetical protein
LHDNKKNASRLVSEVKQYSLPLRITAALCFGIATYFAPYTFNLRLKWLLKNEVVHVLVSLAVAIGFFLAVLSPRKPGKSDFGV